MAKAADLVSRVDNDFVLFEVPLLYEAGMEDKFDAVICVWTSAVSQHKRLKERGFDEKDIRLRMNNQLSSDVKLEKADYGLINESRVELLNEQCTILNHQIREEYGRQG